MDQFKYSVGPFEVFSGFASGLPFLLVIYIGNIGKFDFGDFTTDVLMNTSISKLILIALISYLVGGLVSGISYRYFKLAGRLFKKDYLHLEKVILEDWNKPFKELSSEEFKDLDFQKRLVYLIKKRFGQPKLSLVNDYILPYLRQHSAANAVKSESFIALNIMYRNLSLGFLFLSVTFLYLVFKESEFLNINILYFFASLLLAILTLLRAYTFRNWWTRETLLSFHNIELESAKQNQIIDTTKEELLNKNKA